MKFFGVTVRLSCQHSVTDKALPACLLSTPPQLRDAHCLSCSPPSKFREHSHAAESLRVASPRPLIPLPIVHGICEPLTFNFICRFVG
ncbi:MAG: hypothetical protein ACR2RE_12975, partial [Geminicoccaceae bacterium]